ncbi:hypothetical protein BDW59DRAFT_151285 [Aspergillus cavernicola]|uniref:Uncharacterized protein n=1 Tax=Aspergillus cavernicola TaxID=176166 RepID=A0ABR4HVU4_9EURO
MADRQGGQNQDKTGDTLTPGLSNEELWSLIQRFNKQVSHVQAVSRSHAQLDLTRATEEQFPPAKLQRTIDRFYSSVIVVLGAFVTHITRLRSWNEPSRTGTFGAVYLVAWLGNFLIPMITSVLVALILCPPVRSLLFPPLPKTQPSSDARLDKPLQGTISSIPAINEEQEIESKATDIDGPNGQSDALIEPLQAEILDLENAALPPGDEMGPPLKNTPAISCTMRILSDITDLSERIANLFSPSPPFTLVAPRLRLAGILISMSLVPLVLPGYVIVKTGAFASGLGFFGDPVFKRALDYLNINVPKWKEYLDIEKTLLKGVPTNAQLTLTLLRIGEHNSTPLPPPPGLSGGRYLWQMWRGRSKQIDTAKQDPVPDGVISKAKPKMWLRVLKFTRRAITTALKGHEAFDRAMAMAGSDYAKGLMAILDKSSSIAPSLGSFTFEAKFEKKRGTVVIDSSTEEQPMVYFAAKAAGKLEDLRLDSQKAGSVAFQIPLADIKELKKTEGLGWKGKLIVELAAGSKDSADGLVIQGTEPEQTYHLTGMRGRNQLFNRLIAGGAQFWEMH